MPNKIVQLVDNENNNIYPVAGSLAQDSVTTSTINDGAVTTAKIADGAATSDKLSLATSTQTITWTNSGDTVGETTCTMIPLDNNGLTLCAMGGVAWKTNPSAAGDVNIKGTWGVAPSAVLGAVVNASFSGLPSGYKTYSLTNTTNMDIWLYKTDSISRDINVQMMCLAYFS